MTVIGSLGRAGLGDIRKGRHPPTHCGSFPHGRPVEGPHGSWPNLIGLLIRHGGPVDGPVEDTLVEDPHVTGGGHGTPVEGPHVSPPGHDTPVEGPHDGGTSSPSYVRWHGTPAEGPHDGGSGHDTPTEGPHDGGAEHGTPVEGPHDAGGGHDTPPEVPHNTLANAWVDPPCMDKAANVGAEAAGSAATRTTRMAADTTTSPPMRRLSGPMIASVKKITLVRGAHQPC